MTEPADNPYQTPSPADATSSDAWVDLENYRVTGYEHRSLILRLVWYAAGELFVTSSLPFPSRWKCTLLRWFGAKIGRGVVIKPRVLIKYPWNLEIGDHVWVGEGTWIDNLALVRIGSHVCVSQGVYFCTGSHDHRKRSFDLITEPIVIGDGAWVAARSTLLGGVTVGANALVAAASMVNADVPPAKIFGGVPAHEIRDRQPPENA